MNTVLTAINGSEDSDRLESPEEQAVSLFYRAFNNRNMDLMQQAWLTTPDSSMDNPIGGIRRGWEEISAGYQRIFSGKAVVFVEFYDYTLHTTADQFFVTGRERGYLKTATTQLDLAIRTTRIFSKQAGIWQQIHHHGSIDTPDLLREYQQAIYQP